jgi:predicted transcriptional regulator
MSRMSEIHTTSGAAARAVRPRVSDLARRITDLLIYRPMTPDEVAAAMDESLLTIRPRFSELNKAGLIERTGERRANASGMKAHVWRKTL